VIDALHTRGWKPDAKTLSNTKYIYTDYTVEEIIDEGEFANFTIVDVLGGAFASSYKIILLTHSKRMIRY